MTSLSALAFLVVMAAAVLYALWFVVRSAVRTGVREALREDLLRRDAVDDADR